MSLPTISPAEAKRLLDAGAVLIDIRGPDEHVRERIPSALNHPIDRLTGLDGQPKAANENVRLTRGSAPYLLPRLVGMGFAVGALAGFFGIGGGFLIVPGLMLATGMSLPSAVGTSLVAVTSFGLATAASYGASGLIGWSLALLVVGGGALGAMAGARLNAVLASSKHVLNRLFGVGVIAVGVLIVARGLPHLPGFTQ